LPLAVAFSVLAPRAGAATWSPLVDPGEDGCSLVGAFVDGEVQGDARIRLLPFRIAVARDAAGEPALAASVYRRAGVERVDLTLTLRFRNAPRLRPCVEATYPGAQVASFRAYAAELKAFPLTPDDTLEVFADGLLDLGSSSHAVGISLAGPRLFARLLDFRATGLFRALLSGNTTWTVADEDGVPTAVTTAFALSDDDDAALLDAVRALVVAAAP
jgi:hypothetical protein